MTAKPIIFSAPMIRALLEGRKTQTRRVLKPQPFAHSYDIAVGRYHPTVVDRHGDEQPGAEIFGAYTLDGEQGWRCPYGQPGDLLWVREAFIHEPADYCWEASVSIPCRPAITTYRADQDGELRGVGWTPSIHMPRWASRLTLRITDVRVQRLQEISNDDCAKEGIAFSPDVNLAHEFSDLWESINGLGSWLENPWVWALTFDVIKGNVDDVMREAA